jgi:hypothetical protein
MSPSPWYDAKWLMAYADAIRVVRRVKPSALQPFVEAFRPFRTAPDFRVKEFERVFDDATMTEIRRVVATLRPNELELHEARTFGRFLVHNHPALEALHAHVVPLVSEAAGERVEPAYTFLSLYGARGVCPAHLDSPQTKWTLDLCLNQSGPWPIHIGDVLAWPDVESEEWSDAGWQDAIDRARGPFASYALEPGQAILFSGSSQWHYRDPIPAGDVPPFCDLLFLHFVPAGTLELAEPDNWARLFGIPELAGALPSP